MPVQWTTANSNVNAITTGILAICQQQQPARGWAINGSTNTVVAGTFAWFRVTAGSRGSTIWACTGLTDPLYLAVVARYPASAATLLDKKHASTPLADMPGLGVDAISGVSEADAAALKSAFGIRTIRDLATHEHFQTARVLVDAAAPAPLDQMVGTFRSTNRLNHRVGSLVLAEAGEDPSGESLYDLMHDTKQAPAMTSIAVVDTAGPAADSSGKPTQDAMEIYDGMIKLSALANVVAMAGVYKDHPAKYDITQPDQASAFIQAQVVQLNDVLNRRLGAYAVVAETSAEKFQKQVASADLHLEFLNELFGSFNFSPDALKELDGMLTNIRETLENLKIDATSDTHTLDHLIVTQYIKAVPIEGSSETILSGQLRLFYLKIDQSSWKASIGKSSAEYIDFNMNYIDTIFTVNDLLVRQDLATIAKMTETLTAHSFDEISEENSPVVVSRAPQI